MPWWKRLIAELYVWALVGVTVAVGLTIVTVFVSMIALAGIMGW